VLLKWSTSQKQNTKDFIVQHSADGRQWQNLATVAAAGNSSTPSYYTYTHLQPVTGINWYRLLQRDLDGRQSYSDIRMVKFDRNNFSIQILGNPVTNGQLQLQNNYQTSQQVVMYSSEGKLILKTTLFAGINTIDVSRYAKGVYWLQADSWLGKIVVQ